MRRFGCRCVVVARIYVSICVSFDVMDIIVTINNVSITIHIITSIIFCISITILDNSQLLPMS
jgi:hypothetical protein